MPYNNMGDPTNLTEKDFENAGKTDAIGKAGTVQAKKNAITLLQMEVEKSELEHPKKQY